LLPFKIPTPFFVLAAVLVAALAASANAQTWPDRAIHLVVPAGPGGPTDVLARLIADRLQPALGQPVIVDNRGGAGGAIGARAVAAAPADGHTLMLGNTATLANIPAVSKNAGYDPIKNFAPIAKLTDSYQLLVVTPAFPAKSVAELVAYANANPGKLNDAAVGAGNLTHLSGELLKARAGIDFAIVHYKSGGEALTAVVGGQVQFAIDNVTVVRPLVQDQRLRALAVTSRKRQADFPDLPTMMEAGIPDYEVTSFFGVVAPAATPMDIVDKLNRAINAALRTPDMRTAFANLGAQPATETPQQFAAFIAGELAKWTDLSNSAGIKVD
jgi:tripartite-type tricarboxylate transporter receptor subunit TctC